MESSDSAAKAGVTRRSRKRQATRQHISDVATTLFCARGFEAVTVDEIAAAADVGRMTVFNHFARKEDMFFDRDEEGRQILVNAIAQRPAGTAPIEAVRQLAHSLVAEGARLVDFSDGSCTFMKTIKASETLMARARAIGYELAEVLAQALAQAIGRDPGDPEAELAGHLILATLLVAFLQAHQVYERQQDANQASHTFLQLIDQGFLGVTAAFATTPYAAPTLEIRP